MEKIDLIIPVHNEEANVEFIVQELLDTNVYQKLHSIIFVNDGSNDQTLKILNQLKNINTKIIVITHEGKIGQSAAFYSGIKFSTSKIIITMDGDGQILTKDIIKILEFFYENDFDLVSGVRKKRADNQIKKISSKMAFFIRKLLLNDDAKDTGCSLKVFYRQKYLNLPYFDHMHRFIPVLFKREQYKVGFFDVSHRKRLGGKSKYGFFDRLLEGFFDILGVIWLMRRKKNTKIIIEDE